MNLKKLYLRSGAIGRFSIFGPEEKRRGLPEQQLGFVFPDFNAFPGVTDDNFLSPPSEHDIIRDTNNTGIHTNDLIVKKDEFNMYSKLT